MSDSKISPDRGSLTCGPLAFGIGEAKYLTTEYLTSSGLQSGSSSLVGGSLAIIAFLNPASSNAICQSSIPCFRYFLHFTGVALSI